jgi:hypothetical protein
MEVLAIALIIVAIVLGALGGLLKNPLLACWGLVSLGVSVFIFHALKLLG